MKLKPCSESFGLTLLQKRTLAAVLVAALFWRGGVARAAVFPYSVTLSGANESPANASPATGSAFVVYDSTAHTLQLQVSFSGLVGTVTAAHIHASTTAPGTGTAGVATTTPTFTGFPSGVTSGAYNSTFDLTLASSYNASYVTGNGGTTATAEAALAVAFAAGKAYLNIHTTVFPGGEMRGFLTPFSTVFLDTATNLVAGDSTQLGRVNRNGLPSDWSTNKVFPGVVNPTTNYYYHKFIIPAATIGAYTNLEVWVTDTNTPFAGFTTAYKDAYVPDNVAANRGLDTNYVGDVGGSGTIGAGLLIPQGHDFVLVFSDVAATNSTPNGVGKPFRLVVEGFLTPPVPRITGISRSGTNLLFNLTNMLESRLYSMIANSNISLSRTQWTTPYQFLASATLGANRSMTVTNSLLNTNFPTRIFSLQYK